MKRALIAGISGQDGAYLARLLLDKGYEVIGTSRDAQPSRIANLRKLGIHERIRLEPMSPADSRSVFAVVRQWAPHEIYNLTGQSSVALSFERPVETFDSIVNATVNLLEAARLLAQPARLFNASSGECFGDVPGGIANETTAFRPRSPYAAAKAAAHWMAVAYRRSYSLFACSGILFSHESPLRPEQFVTRKIVSAACRIAHGSKEKLRLGDVSIRRDWGWAPEYVVAMWQTLQREKPDDFVIATGHSHSLEEFAAAAFDAVRLNWRDHVIQDEALIRPADLRESYGNPAKAAKELGWVARHDMYDVVRMMSDAEANNGQIALQNAP